MAINSKSETEIDFFILFIDKFEKSIPCNICKNHFTKLRNYLNFEEYRYYYLIINGEKINVGPFLWTWKLHNLVNIYLNKKCEPFEKIYSMYSN
jgi:hypothetical protein